MCVFHCHSNLVLLRFMSFVDVVKIFVILFGFVVWFYNLILLTFLINTTQVYPTVPFFVKCDVNMQ